ncbi:hypothetical protein C8Q80DRAFT_947981 [Daedaleopsis nitida]|nr:hypothetical protein C8Q80DRAFT_947981 [Daedaleopsis nitida]
MSHVVSVWSALCDACTILVSSAQFCSPYMCHLNDYATPSHPWFGARSVAQLSLPFENESRPRRLRSTSLPGQKTRIQEPHFVGITRTCPRRTLACPQLVCSPALLYMRLPSTPISTVISSLGVPHRLVVRVINSSGKHRLIRSHACLGKSFVYKLPSAYTRCTLYALVNTCVRLVPISRLCLLLRTRSGQSLTPTQFPLSEAGICVTMAWTCTLSLNVFNNDPIFSCYLRSSSRKSVIPSVH